jgi:hypothetical protein
MVYAATGTVRQASHDLQTSQKEVSMTHSVRIMVVAPANPAAARVNFVIGYVWIR